MRIGVYGGTFNPIHRGHLTAARAAADALGLEKVLLIPDNLPPHKALPAGSATGEDRLEMCRLTAGEVPGMEVLDLELRRSGPSYTSDTLAELHAQYPDDELWLLVGSDMCLSAGVARAGENSEPCGHRGLSPHARRRDGALRAAEGES